MQSAAHVITTSPDIRGTVFVTGLPPQRYTYGPTHADFSCGPVVIVTAVISRLSATHTAHRSNRATVENRLTELGISRTGTAAVRSRSSVCALLVHVDVTEPELEVLSYVNELGIAKGAQVLLAWNDAEAAAYVLSLCDSQTAAANSLVRPKAGDSALAALLDFLMTSKVMQKPDATRFADRYETPAQLLAGTQHDLEALPKFGAARAKRMHAILHADFPTTRKRLEEYAPTETQEATPVPTPASHHAPRRTATASRLGPASSSAAAPSLAVHVVDVEDDDVAIAAARAATGPTPSSAPPSATAPLTIRRTGGPRTSGHRRETPAGVAAALARRREDDEADGQSDDDGVEGSDTTVARLLRQLGAETDDA
jgi:hypothetical protein